MAHKEKAVRKTASTAGDCVNLLTFATMQKGATRKTKLENKQNTPKEWRKKQLAKMSRMNPASSGRSKDWRDRSDKDCVCGGHNWKNVKKNLHHHSTKNRLNIRKQRRFVLKQK